MDAAEEDPSSVDLSRLFRPRVVAVVGASDSPGRPTTGSWRMLRSWAERNGARAVPVNPTRETVDDLPCLPTLEAVPGPLDVVVLLISDVASGLEASVRAGAGFVVVFASGFAELGEDGARAQADLVALLEGSSTRMLGPNTNMNAFEAHRTDLGGPAIALISQSGHQGRPLFMLQENGVRVSHWAPTGNEADLEVADFARWFADAPEVGVIAAYLEGVKDGTTFVDAARHCLDRETPMVVVKVGRHAVGQASAASHTGKLAGSDQVADAVFRQHGITRVDTLDQLADTSTLLARAGRPRARGVAVYSISGGTGAHVADLCAADGLEVPTFDSRRQALLHEWIPDYLQVGNPVDCGGHPVGDERGRKILDAIAADPSVGVLLVPIMGPFPPLSDRLAADVVALAEEVDIPVCVVWGSPVGCEAALRDVLYGSERVVVFRSVANAVGAISAWLGWHDALDRHAARPAGAGAGVGTPGGARARSAASLLPAGATLSEHDSKALLQRYGIPTVREELAHDEASAVRWAERAGGPVVLKACSSAIAHKSELGLVAVGVALGDVGATYRDLRERAEAAAPGQVEGVLVCEQVAGGVEMVVGISQDPTFGPTVAVGAGGILVEVAPDVSLRVPPFDRAEAARMVAELRAAPLLAGVRGRPPADVDALVDAVMAVQAMAVELSGSLAELDVNPLLVRPRGEGVVALDALAVATRP